MIEAAQIRYRVDPGDVPPEKAARRLHLTLEHFQELLPRLLARGFPAADVDTGMYDLEAIDSWRRNRHRAAEAPLTTPAPSLQPPAQSRGMAERFSAAKRQTEIGGRRRGVA
jgi:hypothetical protein